jgi:hypothetical protein
MGVTVRPLLSVPQAAVFKLLPLTGGIAYTMGIMTKREEELGAEGWERRFVAMEPRLSEAAELYKSIGFDVLLDPLPTEEELEGAGCEERGCTACFDVDRERYKIIYTRAQEVKES